MDLALAKKEFEARQKDLTALRLNDRNIGKFNEHFEAILKHMLPDQTRISLLKDLLRKLEIVGRISTLSSWNDWQFFIEIVQSDQDFKRHCRELCGHGAGRAQERRSDQKRPPN